MRHHLTLLAQVFLIHSANPSLQTYGRCGIFCRSQSAGGLTRQPRRHGYDAIRRYSLLQRSIVCAHDESLKIESVSVSLYLASWCLSVLMRMCSSERRRLIAQWVYRHCLKPSI